MMAVGSEFVFIFFFKSTFAGFEVGSGPFVAHQGAVTMALSGRKVFTLI